MINTTRLCRPAFMGDAAYNDSNADQQVGYYPEPSQGHYNTAKYGIRIPVPVLCQAWVAYDNYIYMI